MATVNLLVLIHGMTLESSPLDHSADYVALWEHLKQAEPGIADKIGTQIMIEWGHELLPSYPGEPRPDQRLTHAENFIHDRVSFTALQHDDSPNNHLLPSGSELFSQWFARHLTTPVKEKVLILGVTDALYYCSPEGERWIRRAVYTQLLNGLELYRDMEEVRLHVIARSLGATVAFDFLFGLFAPATEFPQGEPGFVHEAQGAHAIVEAYAFWRKRAHEGSLILATKSTTGGQIPLMMLRKQKVVEMLASKQLLDPTVIGIPRSGPPRWKIFYDVDDVLGFPARRLFDADGSIQEFQVDTDWRPDPAHRKYWENDWVVGEIAQLIRQNLGG
jgi:hypothetical protein